MKVLIDRNIEINAITHKTVLVSRAIKWGPHYQTLDVAERIHFPPRVDEAFRIEQLPFLAALCLPQNTASQNSLAHWKFEWRSFDKEAARTATWE
jgi:hypothetical protein